MSTASNWTALPVIGSNGLVIPDGIYTAFLLSLRIGTLLAMTPILEAIPAPTRVKVLLIVALSFAIANGLPLPPAPLPTGIGLFIQAVLTEFALGLTLALGVMVAFAAFSIAGNLLDSQIGFGIAQVFDPSTRRPLPILVSTFNMFAVVVFFLLDGHHALLRGVAYSVYSFPVGQPWNLHASAIPVLKHASSLFALAFALAAPVVFCVLLTELGLGVIARNLPQVNMFTLGIPLKIIVGLATLSFWFLVIGATASRVYGSIYTTWEGVFLSAPQPAAGRGP